MIWEKKGLIFDPDGDYRTINSHAQIPTAIYLRDQNVIRIYFATRPDGKTSRIVFVDVDPKDPLRVLYVHDEPVLELGDIALFDEHGTMPNVVLESDGKIYLYYIGWSRRTNIPYSNWAGLAVSADGGRTFNKVSKAPILDRTSDDLYSAATTSILIEDGIWHLWYVSGIGWIKVDDKYEHTYAIKYAWSKDGIEWARANDFCIQQANDEEAITRSTIIKLGSTYHMWYCFRGTHDFRDGKESYRIGYARSEDRVNWTRMDSEAGILPSESGWDSTMNAYPYLVKVEDRVFMFYNGNGFGKSGFGFAELKF